MSVAWKGVCLGSLRLQWYCFGWELDIKLMFGTIALASEASTCTILALWFAFVALLLALSTSAKGEGVSD